MGNFRIFIWILYVSLKDLSSCLSVVLKKNPRGHVDITLQDTILFFCLWKQLILSLRCPGEEVWKCEKLVFSTRERCCFKSLLTIGQFNDKTVFRQIWTTAINNINEIFQSKQRVAKVKKAVYKPWNLMVKTVKTVHRETMNRLYCICIKL